MKDFEVVFETSDLVEQGWAESLLEEAGISFSVADEQVQHLVGYGQIGGRNLVVGGVKLRVSGQDAARARELLAEGMRAQPANEAVPEEILQEDDSSAVREVRPDEAAARVRRWSRASVIWAVLWAGGIGSLLAVYFGVRALATMRGDADARRAQPIVGIVFGVFGLLLWFLIWGSARPD
jgi:hypothetical protein